MKTSFLLMACGAILLPAGPVLAGTTRPASLPDANSFQSRNFRMWMKYAQSEDSITLRAMAPNALTLYPRFSHQAARILAQRLTVEPLEWIKLNIIDGLITCGRQNPKDTAAADALVRCFHDSKQPRTVRDKAVVALATLRDRRILTTLYAQLSGSVQTRIQALQWLSDFKDADAQAHIYAFFMQHHRTIDDALAAAVAALGKCRYKPALHNLLACMEDHRDDKTLWPQLIAACEAIKPGSAARLRAQLAAEDKGILAATQEAEHANALYASRMRQWRAETEQERIHREKRIQDAKVKAVEAACQFNQTRFFNIFAGYFIRDFFDTRAAKFVITHVELGHVDPARSGTQTSLGYIVSDTRKLTITVDFKDPNGPDPHDIRQAFFFFQPNKNSLAYLNCETKYGPFQSLIDPEGVRDITHASQIKTARDMGQYHDPTAGLPPIDKQYPKPRMSNHHIPTRKRHVAWMPWTAAPTVADTTTQPH